MKKIVFLILTLVILVICGVLFLVISQRGEQVQAGAGDNVFGWAWSENIGWLSFNNTTGGGSTDYGVNIDSGGLFSGYAWSENIGWLSFNQAELAGCPSGACRAEMDTATGQVSGWARALAYGDGWDGWISLRGTNYGVSVDPNPASPTYQEFFGWAWGNTVVGWLSFNCANSETGNVCGTSNYKVQTSFSFNQPPNPPTNLSENLIPCAWGTSPQVAPGLAIILSWDYSDPEGDPQLGYEVWVDEDAGFSGAKFNHRVETGLASSYALGLFQDDEGDWLSTLAWSTTYYWKVRVKDSASQLWSGFSETDSFTTPLHAYPDPEFNWFPTSPTEGEIVQFCATQEAGACSEDKSTCYSVGGSIPSPSCSGKTFLWTFPGGTEFATGSSPISENPLVKFTSIGSKDISLEITDDIAPCTRLKTVGVMWPLPRWKEVAPF